MKNTLSATKWWWGWEPEKVENWLEEMESQGWHLYNATGIGIRFHFVEGEPRKVRYCADYQNSVKPEYKSIFEDAGWQLVYSGFGWYIWRMEYQGERPEIYTDIESLIGRNNRLMTILGAAAALQVPLMTSIAARSEVYDDAFLPVLALYGVLFAFIGYCMYHLTKYSNSLKSRRKNV